MARGVPDDHLGDAFPQGFVQIQKGEAGTAFWVDKNVTYQIFPGRGGLLQSLSSHPVGQGGTIINNVLSGIAKIASAAIGAAPGGAAIPVDSCGPVQKTLSAITTQQAAMASLPAKSRADAATALQALKDSITITMKTTVDPGVAKDGSIKGFNRLVDPQTGKTLLKQDNTTPTDDWLIATLYPSSADYAKAGWYVVGAASSKSDPDTHRDQHINLFLDMRHATLLDPTVCDESADKCVEQPLPSGSLFRQAAYIRVYAKKGELPGKAANSDSMTPTGDEQTFAFGQFGAGRAVPITTGIFKDVSWEVDFTDLGEITKAMVARKATGTNITSVLSGAASAAESINQLPAKADSALDSDTLRLQAENAALKARIDNQTYRQQLEAMGTPADPQ